jgi:hypothetical protein
VHGDPADVVAAHLALAGVQPSAHLDAECLRRVADRHRAADRSLWAVEHREEAVTRGVHLTGFAASALSPSLHTLYGDAEDELYLSDLYCEIARIRYFIRLGGVGATLFEVTDLRYVDGYAQVVTSTPVNEMSVQAAILSPDAWAYWVHHHTSIPQVS